MIPYIIDPIIERNTMKSTEFCYWLQGLFELTQPTELNKEQTSLIRSQLEGVIENDRQPSLFCTSLHGYLKIAEPTQIAGKELGNIKQALGHEFLTVIDPSYGVEKGKKLNEIHNGSPRYEVLC